MSNFVAIDYELAFLKQTKPLSIENQLVKKLKKECLLKQKGNICSDPLYIKFKIRMGCFCDVLKYWFEISGQLKTNKNERKTHTQKKIYHCAIMDAFFF